MTDTGRSTKAEHESIFTVEILKFIVLKGLYYRLFGANGRKSVGYLVYSNHRFIGHSRKAALKLRFAYFYNTGA